MRRFPLGAAALAAALFCARAEAAPERADLCVACHGEGGVSALENVPSLAGQPETFLALQMILFRERIRKVEPMEVVMEGIADADIEALARWYAALPPPPSSPVRDPERVARGRALSAAHRCGVCHRPDYSGQNQVPRLAGQREDYLLHAMLDYQAGTRQGTDTTMQGVLHGLSPRDLGDLAHYLATLR
ncbi:c-type cytochrome [Elioraea sp. Yellowstone]|mgnify:CR=1 FL=1|jgi:cytochrome c553|uniref:c-type cytochrome n=1 Tax=Elioraea sp. Yellowstone TaxID=2592070 RepID=UPI0011501DA2|nr:c-type cytochrome [Elioraea sp. Yellowstone]TQF82037.1 c-type cytochrome [Elioraea sp. Yellowstone]